MAYVNCTNLNFVKYHTTDDNIEINESTTLLENIYIVKL